MEEHKPIRTHC